MPYDTLPPAAAHRVELDGRERLIVSGVDDVDRFDENEIVMTTSAGTLIVTGESLHIGKLSQMCIRDRSCAAAAKPPPTATAIPSPARTTKRKVSAFTRWA